MSLTHIINIHVQYTLCSPYKEEFLENIFTEINLINVGVL